MLSAKTLWNSPLPINQLSTRKYLGVCFQSPYSENRLIGAKKCNNNVHNNKNKRWLHCLCLVVWCSLLISIRHACAHTYIHHLIIKQIPCQICTYLICMYWELQWSSWKTQISKSPARLHFWVCIVTLLSARFSCYTNLAWHGIKFFYNMEFITIIYSSARYI